MKKKRRERLQTEPSPIQMTPMIDVVFQLLIFFIVTLKQEDILSHLDVSRPAPDSKAKPEQIQDLLTILIYKDGFVLRGRRVTLKSLDDKLTRLASYSKSISVIINCTADSPHSYLVQVLDICAKAGLKNLSVFSL